MKPESIPARIVELYPAARLHATAEHARPRPGQQSDDVIRGDAGTMSKPWISTAVPGSTERGEIEVKWRGEEILLMGPRAFVRTMGGTIVDNENGFGLTTLNAVCVGPVVFEDDRGWVLGVSAAPDGERVRTWWLDRCSLLVEDAPRPAIDAWEGAGGGREVAAWARNRLMEAESLCLPESWVCLVVTGAMHRLRPRDIGEAKALVQALLSGQSSREVGMDRVLADWRKQLHQDTRRHYARVAIASAAEIAFELEELAELGRMDWVESRARLLKALEDREDVACVLAAVGANREDFVELARIDERSRRIASQLPVVPCARESWRLAMASTWDVEGWWLGHLDEGDEETSADGSEVEELLK